MHETAKGRKKFRPGILKTVDQKEHCILPSLIIQYLTAKLQMKNSKKWSIYKYPRTKTEQSGGGDIVIFLTGFLLYGDEGTGEGGGSSIEFVKWEKNLGSEAHCESLFDPRHTQNCSKLNPNYPKFRTFNKSPCQRFFIIKLKVYDIWSLFYLYLTDAMLLKSKKKGFRFVTFAHYSIIAHL